MCVRVNKQHTMRGIKLDLCRGFMGNDTIPHITEHDNRISDDDRDGVSSCMLCGLQCLWRDWTPVTVAEKDPKSIHTHCRHMDSKKIWSIYKRTSICPAAAARVNQIARRRRENALIYYIVSNLFNINLHFVTDGY